MDNLSMNSNAAIKAGMSYGKWKAMHPSTKQLVEAEKKKPKYIKQCSECSSEFGTNRLRQHFCSEECRLKNDAKKSKAKKREGQ